jgi:tRNA (cytidine/uridine-2'-O-)-methyltransferase
LTLSVALFEPEIPGNAGAVARLCAATGVDLHLIGRLGFSFEHPRARRAVMDYRDALAMHRHVNYEDFTRSVAGRTVWALSTRAERNFWEAEFAPGDVLLFGPESRGLPEEILATAGDRALRVPMLPSARSLNLSTAVAATLYEALRQVAWHPDSAASEMGEKRDFRTPEAG